MVIIPSNYLTKVKASTRRLFSTKGSNDTLAALRNCYNTTLQEFIDKECYDKWTYTEADWNNVQAEYIDLLDDDRLGELFELRKEITKLTNKLKSTQLAIDGLKLMYYQPLCDSLKAMGYRIKYSQETLLSDLQLTVTMGQSIVLKRDELVKDYKKAENLLGGDDQQITEAKFDENLVVLSKHQGYEVRKSITLSTYIAIKNNFTAYVKAQDNGSRPN